MLAVSSEAGQKRSVFFEAILIEQSGFLCIAKRDPNTGIFEEVFLEWPRQKSSALDIMSAWAAGHDVYYCPTLFDRPKRKKENVRPTNVAWADLDYCPPDKLRLVPTFLIESSPGRHQALWVFEENMPPADAEDISRRIAYAHADDDCDQTGWDLTQLLRVPFTNNMKYAGIQATPPLVKVVKVNAVHYSKNDFTVYEPVPEVVKSMFPFPAPDEFPDEDADQLMEKYRFRLTPNAIHFYNEAPKNDWSKALWLLMMSAYEAGMPREEVFIVCSNSACNKYKREGLSDDYLWKDVCRAWHRFTIQSQVTTPGNTFLSDILTDGELTWAKGVSTVVDEYIAWAQTIGDAAPQYHQAGGFVLLSSLLAGPVRLPTSFGIILPNLWFMILADTTLTRKSTAMDLAIDLLAEIDSEAVLATDGSIEGLFSSLAFRPGRPSVFLRDEFSGLLEMMARKDYYAGMAETFTKMYDGKYQKRVLRKETIEVKEPVLILFAGGIKDRILTLLSYEHISSGFLPRFVFITAESDVSRLKPLGPPTFHSVSQREQIRGRLATIHGHYKTEQLVTVNDRTMAIPKRWDAELSADAWARYNQLEADMMKQALRSPQPDLLTPTFDRLCKSGLKAAILLSCCRELQEHIVVTTEDLVKAFSYVHEWRHYTLDVLNNIGRTTQEKTVMTMFNYIRNKNGALRSDMMRSHHLSSRETDLILATLEQRGLITRIKSGRTERLYPIQGAKQ